MYSSNTCPRPPSSTFSSYIIFEITYVPNSSKISIENIIYKEKTIENEDKNPRKKAKFSAKRYNLHFSVHYLRPSKIFYEQISISYNGHQKSLSSKKTVKRKLSFPLIYDNLANVQKRPSQTSFWPNYAHGKAFFRGITALGP